VRWQQRSLQRRGLAVRVEEEHDRLAQQREGHRPAARPVATSGITACQKLAEHGLAGGQHGRSG
jgi:hypothetical protein